MTAACLLALLAGALLHPAGLRCEYMEDPLIDTPHPRLSWTCEVREGRSGVEQSAYRIEVATDRRFRHKVWDSGRVASGESHLIPYEGEPLVSSGTYYWRVRLWDGRGRRSPRASGRWRTALMDPAEWQADWIGAPWQGEEAAGPYTAAPLLRRTLTVRPGLRSATAYVCGLGWCEFAVNGTVVSDPMGPAFTDYTSREGLEQRYIGLENRFRGYRVLYNRYDIAPLLHKGDNDVTALLGGGYFDVDHKLKKMHPYGTPRLRCRIELTYRDGSREVILSDSRWEVRPSAVTFNEMYKGETYDARQEEGDWAPAVLREAPLGEMQAMTCPPDRTYGPYEPVSIERLPGESFRLDFGEMRAGWPLLRGIRGHCGDTLVIRFPAEEKNGTFRYVFASDRPVSYRPRFAWYASSQAVVSGIDSLTPEMIAFEEVRTAVEENAVFRCSNPLFEHINEIWRRSQKDNMHGCTASDCPHRERLPYTGDGQIAMATVTANFDAAAFYRKWIEDIRLSQDPLTGYVPNGAPWEPFCGGGVAWGAAICIMPWEFYLRYGDTDMLSRNFSAMEGYVRYLQGWSLPDGTILSRRTSAGKEEPLRWLNLGEWAPSYGLPDDGLVHTFYLWLCADCTARSAAVLGMMEKEKAWRSVADSVREAFHERFFDPEKASYGDFGANVFALKMGVPPAWRPAVVETLRKELLETYRSHLNTGMLATRYLFEVLSENGLTDLAYDIMDQRDFPGFGWWIEQGATTTWEEWDGKNSHDHPMMGGGLTWFYKCLAGVDTDPAEPAFRHIIVRPRLAAKLSDVSYETLSPYGKVASRVHHDSLGVRLEVCVPAGCHASVHVPLSGAIHEVGQGTWTFTADKVAE